MTNLTTMDVYDSLPTIVTTFVTIIAKITIFIFLLDLVHYANGPKSEFTWTDILLSNLGNYLTWDQLSKYGNPLKLLIPNNILNNISGWNNHSCNVINQNMIENEMGNRVSKSYFIEKIKSIKLGKEQRVHGSWHKVNFLCLRYTLTGFQRNSQLKILSNRINKKRF